MSAGSRPGGGAGAGGKPVGMFAEMYEGARGIYPMRPGPGVGDRMGRLEDHTPGRGPPTLLNGDMTPELRGGGRRGATRCPAPAGGRDERQTRETEIHDALAEAIAAWSR